MVFVDFYGWREKPKGVSCLNAAVEVFHKPNLSDWQCYSGPEERMRIMYTHMQYT